MHVIRKIAFNQENMFQNSPDKIDREWIVANGLGGYSSMALNGGPLRKYQGILISALPPPLGRTIMLQYIEDSIIVDGHELALSEIEIYENPERKKSLPLTQFFLEDGLPIWIYSNDEIILEKRIFMDYMQNTVHLSYKLLSPRQDLTLKLRPYFQFKHIEAPPLILKDSDFEYREYADYIEVMPPNYPSLYLKVSSGEFVKERAIIENVRFRYEEERGYESLGHLQSIGSYTFKLTHEPIYFVASTEDPKTIKAPSEEALLVEKKRRDSLVEQAMRVTPFIDKSSFALELLFAADQFIILPATRLKDSARLSGEGDEARTVIAGYHWFTDWGRDMLISLEGLLLITGRFKEAAYTLKTIVHHLRDGLLPNMFPDGKREGIYNTVDATLWFFHALERYLYYSKDYLFVKELLPALRNIIEAHIKGTKFGIHVDLNDGLLTQGQEGYALTWMDAVFEGKVITPRRGKAVEINALWYNTLSLFLEWIDKYQSEEEVEEIRNLKQKAFESFNAKFWMEEKKYLFDIVDGEKGNDSACRPNQIFAMSLKYPVLKREHWNSVLKAVHDNLLTPFGLRTLSPDHPDFKLAYKGNLFLRDTAYHQGTVWPWLLGPFIDAWSKVYPENKDEIKRFLEKFDWQLSESGVGCINEIFDAENPYTHRGCISQAWSVAEILRSWVKVCQ